MLLEMFYEKVAEGLLASAVMDIQEQGAAGRLLGKDHFLYRIPTTHVRLEVKSQRSCRMCAERSKRKTGKTVKKCTTIYCRKCDVGLRIR
jgi:late competence protein required for DNA uptake (superfamily II DNA/RNA helicase)